VTLSIVQNNPCQLNLKHFYLVLGAIFVMDPACAGMTVIFLIYAKAQNTLLSSLSKKEVIVTQ
jgi:hypothetical protein